MFEARSGTQRVVVMLGFLFVVMTLSTIRLGVAWFAPPPEDIPVARINPNKAPWYELAELPGIGEKTARAIVDYREAFARERPDEPGPVFRRAADLADVPGIGPKTVAKIAPYLRFEMAVGAG
jgi:competence ComEA-like helix-hairpin-helix protein